MELVTRLSDIAGVPVLSISGEIDMATLPQLHSALAASLRAGADGSVIVDLDGVYACDDAALGVLLGSAGRIREMGGELVVVCGAGALNDRLARTGFDRAIHVVTSSADAVLALRSRAAQQPEADNG